MFWAIPLQNSTSATNLNGRILNVRQEDKYHVTLLFRIDTFKFHRKKKVHENQFNTYAVAVKLIHKKSNHKKTKTNFQKSKRFCPFLTF